MRKLFLSRIKIFPATLLGFAILGLAGSSYFEQKIQAGTLMVNQTTHSQSANPDIAAKLVAGDNRFGFKLLSEILATKLDQNVFISPSSVAIALAMVYNGAEGSTQQAMARTLELQGISLPQLNQANATLKAAMENSDPQVQLAIANSLWARQGIPLAPNYIKTVKTFYSAEVRNLNFTDPQSVSIINNWVKQKTNERITEIIDRISSDSILFLINAIYFKGKWSQPFDKNLTQNHSFTLLNGTQKTHTLMFQSTGNHSYYENNLFQAVSLPYGQGRFSLYVFLPKQAVGLKRFYENLNAENWNQWMQQFTRKEGSIGLPRFKLKYEIQLNQALTALGMGIAFHRDASFSRLLAPTSNAQNQKLYIDEVKHKTFVEVNEEGTEAAAVTSVGVRTTSISLDRFNLIVDRPFFCAIRDNQTGAILFMGSIVEPQ